MKLGTWWVVCHENGTPHGIGESEHRAWVQAWNSYAWSDGMLAEFKEKMQGRGWTCEKVEIRRPE